LKRTGALDGYLHCRLLLVERRSLIERVSGLECLVDVLGRVDVGLFVECWVEDVAEFFFDEQPGLIRYDMLIRPSASVMMAQTRTIPIWGHGSGGLAHSRLTKASWSDHILIGPS
jgi:hypothetical protein